MGEKLIRPKNLGGHIFSFRQQLDYLSGSIGTFDIIENITEKWVRVDLREFDASKGPPVPIFGLISFSANRIIRNFSLLNSALWFSALRSNNKFSVFLFSTNDCTNYKENIIFSTHRTHKRKTQMSNYLSVAFFRPYLKPYFVDLEKKSYLLRTNFKIPQRVYNFFQSPPFRGFRTILLDKMASGLKRAVNKGLLALFNPIIFDILFSAFYFSVLYFFCLLIFDPLCTFRSFDVDSSY